MTGISNNYIIYNRLFDSKRDSTCDLLESTGVH